MAPVDATSIPMNLPMRAGVLKAAGWLTRNVRDPLALLRRFPALQDGIPRLPVWRNLLRAKQSTLFWLLFRSANNAQAAFRPSPGIATRPGAFDTWDLAHTQAEYLAGLKQPYISRREDVEPTGTGPEPIYVNCLRLRAEWSGLFLTNRSDIN